jgi:hypothetical protein
MAKISNIAAYPNISNIDAADYLIITDAENNLMTKTCTISQLQSNFGVDTLVAHVEVTASGLQSLATGFKIIEAQGANKVIDVIDIAVYGQFGSAAYDFSDDLEFDCNSTVNATISNSTANGNADYSQKLILGGGSGNSLALSANQPLSLFSSSNPTQGDGKLFVNLFYRVLTLGTTF